MISNSGVQENASCFNKKTQQFMAQTKVHFSLQKRKRKEMKLQKLTSAHTLNTVEDPGTWAGLANPKHGFLFPLCPIRSAGKSMDLSEPQVLHLENGF